MGLDTHSQETVYRRRNSTSSSSYNNESSSSSPGRSEVKITYKPTSAEHINNNGTAKEDEFDAEITTLNSAATDRILDSTDSLPHDEALDKLKELGAKTPILPSQIGTDFSYKRQVVWSNAIGFLVLHLCAVIGIVLVIIGFADYRTVIYCEFDFYAYKYVCIYVIYRTKICAS